MRIDGKEVGEFNDVKSLANKVEESLDSLVLKLQQYAIKTFKAIEENKHDYFRNFERIWAYEEAIKGINERFGTDYEYYAGMMVEYSEKPCKRRDK